MFIVDPFINHKEELTLRSLPTDVSSLLAVLLNQ